MPLLSLFVGFPFWYSGPGELLVQLYQSLTTYLSSTSGWFAGAPTALFHLFTGLFFL